MRRKITLNNTVHVVDFGTLESARVTIQNGAVAVSSDLNARTPNADFEGIFVGSQSIEILAGPEDVEFGPLEIGAGEALSIAREKRKDVIKKAWEHEIAAVGMPVPGENFAVNFDVVDALIWEAGRAMSTEDPVQVRTMENAMRPLPREKALTIPALQKKHYADMIQKKWRLQAEVEATTTVEAVEAVTWTE